jgi:hypothetical protein
MSASFLFSFFKKKNENQNNFEYNKNYSFFFFGFPLLNWKYPEVMMYMGHMGSGIVFFFFFVKI